MLNCFSSIEKKPIPIDIITQNQYPAWLKKQDSWTKEWLQSSDFKPETGRFLCLPDKKGKLQKVIFCQSENDFWSVGSLPFCLPEGQYVFKITPKEYPSFALAWGLGAYQFVRYKKPKRHPAQLFIPKTISSKKIINQVESIYLIRTLINTPTDDMLPSHLAASAEHLSKQYKAKFKQIIGKDLLKQNYPSIYTVGRASGDAPRLIDFTWGNPKHPKVTLVGKGVCFDSGGLNIKPASGMLLMKKDMGGSAHALGLAKMIMEAKLPIRLRVLIPAVENAVSGNAFRPGDVITSRKGVTIEVGNTDAEGRVVLADALTEAVSEKPDLLIDFATLTGAARVALGTDLPAMFSNNDKIANQIIQACEQVSDPVWRMPLFSGYRESLVSPVADLTNNPSDGGYGGAITAALFLQEFVPNDIPWIHYDMMAWNLRSRPGRPQGGEAMAVRGLFHYLESKYS